MTKRFEFNWHIPVPEQLLKGCCFERWTEEKENVEYESKCLFRVDEYGFFIYWKSEGRVSTHKHCHTRADRMEFFFNPGIP
jgi:phosphatidylinositol phospholipase C beta